MGIFHHNNWDFGRKKLQTLKYIIKKLTFNKFLWLLPVKANSGLQETYFTDLEVIFKVKGTIFKNGFCMTLKLTKLIIFYFIDGHDLEIRPFCTKFGIINP